MIIRSIEDVVHATVSPQTQSQLATDTVYVYSRLSILLRLIRSIKDVVHATVSPQTQSQLATDTIYTVCIHCLVHDH